MMKKILASLLLSLPLSVNLMQAQSLSLAPYQGPTLTELNLPHTSLATAPATSEMWTGYWDSNTDENLFQVGAGYTPMKYNAAIGYTVENIGFLRNKTIEGIRFAVGPSKYLKNLKVWMSTFLPQSPEQADICCQDYPYEGQLLNEMRFNKPYTVQDDKPLYVGYAFDITNGNESNEKYPIVYADKAAVPNAFLLQLDGTTWTDYVKNKFGVLAINMLISGSYNEVDVVMNTDFPENICTTEGCTIPVTLKNYGTEGVQSVRVSTVVGDVTNEQDIVLTEPVTKMGESFTINVPLQVPQAPAYYPYSIKLLQINGKPLPTAIEGNASLYVVSEAIARKVVVEEFTGMWCGHCPRGMVAMEKLKEKYGDQVVLIAAHSQDALACKDYENVIQSTVSGFPAAHINRTIMKVDPYFGQEIGTFGIDPLVSSEATQLPLAKVCVQSELNGNQVNATAEVKFLYSSQTANYAVGYVLVENGMTRSSWGQSNYLSGDRSYLELDPAFEEWVNAGRKRGGVIFNDVAIAAKGISKGVVNSIPETIVANQTVTHSISFDLNKYNKIIDRNQLLMAVILFNRFNGHIVNADIKPISQNTGIEAIEGEGTQPIETARYALDGRRLNSPQPGINLVQYSNGTVRKVYVP